jgi:hypothetical protein
MREIIFCGKKPHGRIDTGQHAPLVLPKVGCMSDLASAVVRPMCPTCKHRLRLARISPGKRGYEERTFECSTCERVEKLSFPVDPMKTNAVGWLASELRPPTN